MRGLLVLVVVSVWLLRPGLGPGTRNAARSGQRGVKVGRPCRSRTPRQYAGSLAEATARSRRAGRRTRIRVGRPQSLGSTRVPHPRTRPRARAAQLSDVSYAIELDLTGPGTETFGVPDDGPLPRPTARATTFLELTDAADAPADRQRHARRPGVRRAAGSR